MCVERARARHSRVVRDGRLIARAVRLFRMELACWVAGRLVAEGEVGEERCAQSFQRHCRGEQGQGQSEQSRS